MQVRISESEVYIGRPVQLEPDGDGRADPYYQKKMHGKISYINRNHRFFAVSYEQFGHKLTECFKF